jgi:hypothetical protein
MQKISETMNSLSQQLARQVIECFEEEGLDRGYIEEKAEKYAKLSRCEMLHELYSLDAGNRERLAAKIGCSDAELDACLSVLKKISN